MNSDKKAGSTLTMQDIAERVGISRAAVSIVMRGAKGVSRETRDRVLAAIEETGYVYNRSAARMRSKQTNTVGLFIPQTSNPYYWEFVSGVDEVLSSVHLVAFLANTNEDPTRQALLLDRMREHAVDGIIISPAADTPAGFIDELRGCGIPFTQAVRQICSDDLDVVAVDSRRGIALLIEHIVGLGHERIAFIGGEENMSVTNDRRGAFNEFLESHGSDVNLVYPAPSTFQGGASTMNQLLRSSAPPTAVVCFNDYVAMGATVAIREKGLKVGLDISVTGFDNIKESALWIPPLTTIEARARDIGREAARLLIQRMGEPASSPIHVTIPPKLVIRESTAPPPK